MFFYLCISIKIVFVSTTIYNNPDLIFSSKIPEGMVGWQSPSNIALVKYWGKKEVQIPCNPSISFTLSKSVTNTVVEYKPSHADQCDVRFFLEEKENVKFAEKIKSWLDSIEPVFPFIKQLSFTIHSGNTFPHSAGIASSASGMSALALCLCSIEKAHFGFEGNDEEFFRKASYIARLGSGSAARSLFGKLVSWGKITGDATSSDLWGTQQVKNIHPDFLSFHDSIIIVDAAQKKVSSRVGHGLMNSNPFAHERFKQAQSNIVKLTDAMKNGDMETFINITESEALTLHAMMMTSNPYYLLLKPNTLQIIERVFEYRANTGIPVAFTLDAGPNIHLLYPDKVQSEVKAFIDAELKQFAYNEMIIEDHVGEGPVKLSL